MNIKLRAGLLASASDLADNVPKPIPAFYGPSRILRFRRGMLPLARPGMGLFVPPDLQRVADSGDHTCNLPGDALPRPASANAFEVLFRGRRQKPRLDSCTPEF
jgi:hypothetical protein